MIFFCYETDYFKDKEIFKGNKKDQFITPQNTAGVLLINHLILTN